MATRYLTVTDTAKLLRQVLKAEWPDTRFSVKSSKYAGGASIRVGWVDGPTEWDVSQVTDLYRGAEFDGMTDCKTPVRSLAVVDGEPVELHYGADFIFAERSFSDPFVTGLCLEVRPSGNLSHQGQCRYCGGWMEPGPAWWVDIPAGCGRSGGIEFVCRPWCGAKLLARAIPGPSRTVTDPAKVPA